MAGEAGTSAAFAAVFRKPALRRVQLAWAASHLGHVAISVGLAVYAYTAGGAAAVGLVYVLRLVPAAIATPFAALAGDRFSRTRVMLASNGARFVLAAAIPLVVEAGSNHWVVYGLCIGVSVAGTPFRPAQVAMLPSLVDVPEELTAANVVASTIEGLGFFAGPALAGILLAATGTTAVFVFVAAAFAIGTALLVVPLPGLEVDRRGGDEPDESLADAVLAGARTIVRDRDLRVLVGLFTGQTLVAGALAVLLVVTAIKLLHTGPPGVGWLDAAVGVGGVLGAVVAIGIAGRRRLTPPFLIGIVLWGAPFLVIAAWPTVVAAVLAFAVIGVGNILVDVAGYTLLQRAVDDSVLARVFGALEALSNASMGIGALIVPPLVSELGARWTLVITGVFLPLLALLVGARLLDIDGSAVAPVRAVALLRELPLFAPLSALALERVAFHLEPLSFEAGVEVITQGEIGDRYYILASGTADVFIDGKHVNRLEPGEGFGEIALLRDVPRTATVTTTEQSELFALGRETFLDAVSSNRRSSAAADAAAERRLGAVSGSV
ncbi:MAG TPA: MFS transporter [Gaiellaceae bacterium]